MGIESLLYQFIVGGVVFTIGLVVPWHAGDFSWKNRCDRRLLLSMLAVCLLYLIVQFVWHLYAAGAD